MAAKGKRQQAVWISVIAGMVANVTQALAAAALFLTDEFRAALIAIHDAGESRFAETAIESGVDQIRKASGKNSIPAARVSEARRIARCMVVGKTKDGAALTREQLETLAWNDLVALCPSTTAKGAKKGARQTEGAADSEGAAESQEKTGKVTLYMLKTWAQTADPKSVLMAAETLLQTLVDRKEIPTTIKTAVVKPIETLAKIAA